MIFIIIYYNIIIYKMLYIFIIPPINHFKCLKFEKINIILLHKF